MVFKVNICSAWFLDIRLSTCCKCDFTVILKVTWAAFAVTCFQGLSDVHECSGDYYMTPSHQDKQTTSIDWLIKLASYFM